jgi:hypothetical protein
LAFCLSFLSGALFGCDSLGGDALLLLALG